LSNLGPQQQMQSAAVALPTRLAPPLEDIAAFARAVGAGDTDATPDHLSEDPDAGWMSRPFVHERMAAGRAVIRGVRVWFGGHVLRLSPDGYDVAIASQVAQAAGVYMRLSRSLAHHALMAELQRHAHEPNPVGSFMFWNRTRRVLPLVPYGLYAGVVTFFAPYVDRDVYDFLTSLPGPMLEDRQFHNDAIRRAYPKYADILFSMELSAEPRTDRWFNRRFVAGIISRLAARRPSAFIRRGYLLPRLAKHLWNGTNGYRRYPPYLILHLLQLGRITAG
jgi:hypothetical protein